MYRPTHQPPVRLIPRQGLNTFTRPVQQLPHAKSDQPIKQQSQQLPHIKTDQAVKQAIKQQAAQQPQQHRQVEKKYQTMTGPQLVDYAYTSFKSIYNNKVKKTTISSIVNGEIITTKPENIFVDQKQLFDEAENEKLKAKFTVCNKTLYNYQIDAIKKIRELELNGNYICDVTGEHIISNGWLLHTPIGSGKSLIFTFIALLYRNVPANPIIISTSGINIPETEKTQLKYYPFYYENVGYIEGKENSVTCLKNYKQRQTTVIITHDHLIEQLIYYIKTDFKQAILNKTTFCVARTVRELNINCDILIVPATIDIINRLVGLSYEMPFMRVIVDDYTNMSNVEEYRQIWASSTLFVSGSGFERDPDKIPPSYYTLRHIDVEKYSLVANTEDTLKGILRDSIATLNLMGSETEFSSYKFVDEIDQYCTSKYHMVPGNLYEPIIKNKGLIKDYLALSFLIKNFDRFNFSIHNIEDDLKDKKLNPDRVKYYIEWKKTLNEKSKELIMKDGKQITTEVQNPFREALFNQSSNISQSINPLVQQKCQVCGEPFFKTAGWGFVSTCCGSFFCINCAKSMVTHRLSLHETDDPNVLAEVEDPDHYYCCVCHKCEPTFFVNSSKHKDKSNVQAFSIVNQFMINDDLINCAHVDYLYYMFLYGFKPGYADGRIITVEMEDNYDKSLIEAKKDYNKLVPTLYPRDRLAMLAISKINDILKNLEIKPVDMNTVRPCILIYDSPDYIQKRLQDYFDTFRKNKESSLYGLDLVFKKDMGSLIGLHRNILAILVWQEPENKDEIHQLIGRILRLNAWNNPLYFYITCKDSNNFTPNIVEPEKLGGDIMTHVETPDELEL